MVPEPGTPFAPLDKPLATNRSTCPAVPSLAHAFAARPGTAPMAAESDLQAMPPRLHPAPRLCLLQEALQQRCRPRTHHLLSPPQPRLECPLYCCCRDACQLPSF